MTRRILLSKLHHAKERMAFVGLASVPYRVNEIKAPNGVTHYKIQMMPRTLDDLRRIKEAPKP